MSSINLGPDGSGDASPEGEPELPSPAIPHPPPHLEPVVPDAPTIIRSFGVPGPIDKQVTVISGGAAGPLPSPGGLNTNELGNLLEGEMLGPLRLDKFIGGGGMGAVFRAHDTNLQRTVAVKILRGQGAAGELKKRFQLEAQSAARLDHENIARVFYVGEHDGWNYIVFEYIEGINIRDLVNRNGPLSVDDVVNFTLQIAEALNHASRRDVVHRDIKPSNILVTPSGHAKLVDMGLARLHHLDSGNEELTASGVTLGTFDYISPEQARDPRSADVRSDIYSLGCTLFFMLSGQPPFSEGTVLQKLLSHTSEEPPDIRQYRGDVPSDLGVVLREMLAKRPSDRQQTASQLIGELLLVAEKFGLASADRSGTVWIAPAARKLSFWERQIPWAVSCAILAAILFGYDYLVPTPTTPPVRPEIMTDDVGPTRPNVTDPRTLSSNQEDPSNGNATEAASAPPTATDREGSEASDQSADPAPNRSNGGDENGTAGGDVPEKMREELRALPPASQVADDVADSKSSFGPYHLTGKPSLIVVGPRNGERTSDSMFFADLASALNYIHMDPQHATRLKAIELRYSGRGREPQRPVSIRLPRLTIQAGDGFQPRLAFHPWESEQISMMTLLGTELTLRGIQCQVELPYPVDQWSFFSLQSGSRLSLKNCTLTLRNSIRGRESYYENAAFFDLARSPTVFSTESTADNGSAQSLSIELENCIVRGEATVLRAHDSPPVQFVWRNGFLATTERMFDVALPRTSTLDTPWVKVSLSQLTAVTDEGLCHLAHEHEASLEPIVEFQCDESVFLFAGGAPLIREQTSASNEPMPRIRFQGGQNVFLHSGADPSVRLPYLVVESNLASKPWPAFDFHRWCRLFPHSSASWNEVQISPWKLPGNDRPTHSLTPGDYAWNQLMASSRMRNHSFSAGMQADSLPQLPALSIADPPARTEPNGNVQ